MTGLAKELMERRVPHMLALYAGGSWALIEFTGFLVDEFLLSPHWTRVVMTALLLLVPSVAMLAWFHGRRGRDDVPLTEKIGIPANLAVAAVALFLLFGGRDLGAATTAVSVETEDGETVERVIPKTEFRKRAALFPFDAGPGLGEDEAWLTYAAPTALELDLAADDFFEAVAPSEFAHRLFELGLPDLRGVPLALRRQISEDFHAPFMVAGAVDRSDAGYRVTLTVHEARRGSPVSETVHEGPDFLALVDEMSATLAEALRIPDRPEVQNLPVRERLTENHAAWEAFGRASEQLFLPTLDLDTAIEQFDVATTLDPTFALAQYELALLLLAANEPEEAIAPISMAVDNAYRLPERAGFMVKSDYYFITQQADRAWAVIEMWVDLYPEDTAALGYYSLVQTLRGDWEGLLETLGTLYRLSPGEHSLLMDMADVHRRLGRYELALSALGRYVEQFPDDVTGHVEMARIDRRRGEHERAREHLGRAMIIAPTLPELAADLASIDLDTGRFEEARRGYEQALGLADTPEQRAAALDGLKAYYRFRGQIDEAIGTTHAWLDEVSQILAPVEIAQDRFADIDLYLEAGRDRHAALLLDSLQAQLPPALAEFQVPRWRVRIALGAGDGEAARLAYDAAIDAMEANDFGVQRPLLIADRGRIDELEGDYDAAVARFRAAMALDPGRNLHLETGRALRGAGRLGEAETELREALRRIPADPHAHLEMALVLEANGDIEGAREHVRSALAAWEPADEGFEPAREARAKLAELSGAS
ncbi:tetratricopeptide repeat protein [Candidatus Palauibacter irciniicola]|uniref:tetratricopeptide repeat protein n=1 Tax=Candidatus Palauibacter irciniicola TaxID=3056733 RepID=UPI003B01FEB4